MVSGWTIDDNQPIPEAAKLAISWFESKHNEVTADVADLFSKYRLSEALMAVYTLGRIKVITIAVSRVVSAGPEGTVLIEVIRSVFIG